jgi:hypothetical protein
MGKFQDNHELIVGMAAQGYLLKEIAEKIQAHPQALGQYIRRNGIHHTVDRSRWTQPESACSRHHETVVAMAESGATIRAIAETVGTNLNRVRQYLTKHGIQRPQWREPKPGSHPMSRRTEGPLNSAWKGGRTTDKHGYVLLWLPGHPESNRNGYVREHRIVMARKIGRPLTREEVVDHIDGNTGNNVPENLRLFPNNADHLRATLTGVPCPARGRKRTSNPFGTETGGQL